MNGFRVSSMVLVFASAIACSSVEPPDAAIARAERGIGEAQQRDARPYAQLELHQAEEHFEQARAALREEEYEKARELAEKAEIEAQLALAKRNAGVAEQSVAELRNDIEALRSEIERATQRR